jgi:DNA-binding NarL/FixJ family response regulator
MRARCGATLSDVRVLLVDDHEITRVACRAVLETEGIEVLADVEVGDRAFAAAAALAPDVILLDVGLGDPRALALAERLERTSAVVLTSSAHRERLGAAVAGYPFVEKLEVSAEQLKPHASQLEAR